jgi:hypothetical protein
MGQDDLRMRLRRSVISYRNEPVWVSWTESPFIGVIPLKDLGGDSPASIQVALDSPDLSVADLGARLGYYQYDDNRVAYMCRYPIRQFCQGLSSNNLGMYIQNLEDDKTLLVKKPGNVRSDCPSSYDPLDFVDDDDFRRIRNKCEDLGINTVHYMMYSPVGFTEAFKGNYINYLDPDMRLEKGHYALSKEFFLSVDDWGQKFIANGWGRLALLNREGFCMKKDKDYFAGPISRKLNIEQAA